MDSFTLDKLEFEQVRQILTRFCRCALGRNLAGRIGPSRRPDTVRKWLEETSQMVRALCDAGTPPFGGITDIREHLGRAHPGGGASGQDFAVIASALEGAGAVRRWGLGLDESLNLLRETACRLPEFGTELEAIRSVVDSGGGIFESASETLARTRRAIEEARRRIHEIVYGYIRRPDVAKILQNTTVTLHDDRFVLPVKAEHRRQLPGVVHRASNTGATVFVEPNESVELNNALVELLEAERREIARLLNELAIRIHHRHDDIASAMRTLGQIDLLTAKAQYAYEFEFTCPEITDRGGLQLHQARHPLLIEQAWQQEKKTKKAGTDNFFEKTNSQKSSQSPFDVIPIDVRLGMDFDILIITGPNTGGKTVALKTIALLAIMAQSGLHIPAQRGSTLPVFRNVLLDVGDEQSLQQSLSTFGGHIRRVRNIIRQADRFSLVLLDELGAGTDPDEGAAIGQAVLDALRRTGCLAMVSTHLAALKAYAFNHDRADNASVEFDTRTLRPTYHLRIGEPGESHAITVAAAMGLPKQMIASARKYLGEKGGVFRKAIRATSSARRASETARAKAHTARLAAEDVQEQYESKLADLFKLQEKFENWTASLAEMKPGDEIHVPTMNKPGRLVRIQFNKQIAVVDVDNVQVEVPLAELMPDMGQKGIRREIASLREQIMSQARQTAELRTEAEHIRQEYHRSLTQQRSRRHQFEQWLAEIGGMKVGDVVPIAPAPGKGKVIELDLTTSRAKIQTPSTTGWLRLQELFPQTGPFAVHRKGPKHRPHKKTSDRRDQPVHHRRPDSAAAKANRQAVLATAPGEKLYVVPFRKQATLIRFNHDKDHAVVQAGAFEMQIPIADLEPARKTK